MLRTVETDAGRIDPAFLRRFTFSIEFSNS